MQSYASVAAVAIIYNDYFYRYFASLAKSISYLISNIRRNRGAKCWGASSYRGLITLSNSNSKGHIMESVVSRELIAGLSTFLHFSFSDSRKFIFLPGSQKSRGEFLSYLALILKTSMMPIWGIILEGVSVNINAGQASGHPVSI